MHSIGLLLPIILLAGLFLWFRASRGEAPSDGPAHGRISLLTEAVGYVGAVLMLAGAVAALAQRWDDVGEWTRLGVAAGAALFLLGVGFLTRRSAEPAFGRLTSVVWLLSTAALAGALAELTVGIVGTSDETAFVTIAAATTAWAGALYAIHRVALQHLALYVGILVTALAALQRIDPEVPFWVSSVTAWAIGLGWIVLGERRLVPPWWVALPVGMLTVLIAPISLQDSGFAAMFAVGIGTAAGLMAFSVRGKYVPGLALGSVGLFGYVTGAVVHYFGDSLGVPAALAMTGAVILVIAAVTSRLARVTRTPRLKPS